MHMYTLQTTGYFLTLLLLSGNTYFTSSRNLSSSRGETWEYLQDRRDKKIIIIKHTWLYHITYRIICQIMSQFLYYCSNVWVFNIFQKSLLLYYLFRNTVNKILLQCKIPSSISWDLLELNARTIFVNNLCHDSIWVEWFGFLLHTVLWKHVFKPR